ncbi:MAG: 3-phosphoshikimate 1-carboxyvinyltransferase [Candidatus Ancillula sp.]|nr:3-phosphoshikimate 1-carboxyvinyltransferase [Candidatus Ancillula sp.]
MNALQTPLDGSRESQPKVWDAPYLDAGKIQARVEVPGSKSLSNRYLVLQYLSSRSAKLTNLLKARDTELMINALTSLSSAPLGAEVDIFTGLAGTVMRFVPPLAALREGVTNFDGDAGARNRPQGAILDALEALGAEIVRKNGDFLPFSIRGKGALRGGRVELDASGSSQFVSALLLVGPRFKKGLHIVHTGAKIPSLPHIDMTLDVLNESGIKAYRVDDRFEWMVSPGEVNLPDVYIEPDLSNAGPFMCAALANPSGGVMEIPSFPDVTTQPGAQFLDILPQFGAKVLRTHDETPAGIRSGASSVRIASEGNINGIDVDLRAAGEITPTVAALCALANGESYLRGVGHLRGHETDRLESIKTEVQKLGRSCAIIEDDIIHIGEMPPGGLKPVVFESYHDHRMATFGAIVGLRVHGCKVVDIETTSKTMPEFPALWAGMLAGESVSEEVVAT